MAASIQSIGQITFEHTYSIQFGMEGLFLTNIGNNNYKWVIYDYWKDKFSLYNIDHSPFMLNVPLAISSDSGRKYTIGYISNSLFDCDTSTLEYAIFSPGVRDTLNFYICRTDGTILFSRDSVTIPYGIGYNNGSVEIRGIYKTNVGTKMVLFNRKLDCFVYSLCGNLLDKLTEITSSTDFVKVFPVPSSNEINFSVVAPDNLEQYELIIFNAQFQTIRSLFLEPGKSEYNLNCSSLSSGGYFYSLQGKNKIVQSGKFIISK